MNEEQVLVEEENTPSNTELAVVPLIVVEGQQIPDPDATDPGVNSVTI